jgi:hypothetical protein
MNEESTSPQISSASNDQASMASIHGTISCVLRNGLGVGGTPELNIEQAKSAAAGAAAAAAAATDKKQALQVRHSVGDTVYGLFREDGCWYEAKVVDVRQGTGTGAAAAAAAAAVAVVYDLLYEGFEGEGAEDFNKPPTDVLTCEEFSALEKDKETGFSPELALALLRGVVRKPLTESEQNKRTEQIRICAGGFLDAAEQEHLKTKHDAWVLANGSSKSTRKGERALRINCSRTTSFSHRCYSYLLVLLL